MRNPRPRTGFRVHGRLPAFRPSILTVLICHYNSPPMREDFLPGVGDELRDRTIGVVRAQWAALGAGATAPGLAAAVVDPEALVLASLGLVDHDRPLAGTLAWWAARGSGLMSVQRIRNLSARFPDTVRHRLKEFAASARSAGDHRWKGVAGGTSVEAASPEGGDPRLGGAAGTLLRLRLGLGVGIKADLVGALVGAEGWWRVRELAASTGYTSRAVRRAAEELARGGWIAASPASPAEYRADVKRWLPMLGLGSPAPWRDWSRLFALVLAVDAWLRAEEWPDRDPGELEGQARRLVDAHRPAFKWSGVPVPSPTQGSGSDYSRAFCEASLLVTRWMEEGV